MLSLIQALYMDWENFLTAYLVIRRAEQLAIAQKMEDRLPRKVARRSSIGGTLKKQKFLSQDRLDESSFGEGKRNSFFTGKRIDSIIRQYKL